MDIEKLEQLNSLKEKGIITQEEFDEKKKEILEETDEARESKGFSWKNVGIISGISIVVIIIALSLFSESMNFSCDESSMKQAQNLFNDNFQNLNGSLRLMKPTTVSQSENYIRCKTETNFRDFPIIYYNLEKQPNGEILITSNPLGDVLEEASKDFENSVDSLVNGFGANQIDNNLNSEISSSLIIKDLSDVEKLTSSQLKMIANELCGKSVCERNEIDNLYFCGNMSCSLESINEGDIPLDHEVFYAIVDKVVK